MSQLSVIALTFAVLVLLVLAAAFAASRARRDPAADSGLVSGAESGAESGWALYVFYGLVGAHLTMFVGGVAVATIATFS